MLKSLKWMLVHDVSYFDPKTTMIMLTLVSKEGLKEGINLLAKHMLKYVLSGGKLVCRMWYKKWLLQNSKYLDPNMLSTLNFFISSSKNQLVNASFKNGKEGWNVEGNFDKEDSQQYKLFPYLEKQQFVLSGSYDLGSIKQVVKLNPDLTNYYIQAGVYVGRRWDCDSMAECLVEIFNEKDEKVETRTFTVNVGEFENYDPNTQSVPYKFACFNIPVEGGHELKTSITISTKDAKWWAGNYAARISHPFIRVIPLSKLIYLFFS